MTAQLASQLQDALGSDYRVEQELAGGGMSRLFIATDLRHDRRVVVKVLSPELVSTESTARFRREIELTVRLQHPHILPILTSGSWEDVLYYITPFILGESLKARIERDKKLPLDDIVKILRDVSGALAFAHQRGIVHRDVKPGNILLAEGHAILADFGIARAMVTNATPLTGSGMVPGTPAYMAPELPTDEKADVYALGVVAYEMLAGQLPKRGAGAKDIIAARATIPGDRRASLHALADIVAEAMSVSPDNRIANVQAFAERLRAEPPRGNGSRKLVAGIAGAVVLAIAAWVVPRARGTNPDRFAIVPVGRDSLDVIRYVNDALAEWRDVSFVDLSVVADGKRRGLSRLDAKQATAIARDARAGRLVLTDTWRESDSIIVRATVYDARTDSTIRTRRVAYAQAAKASDRVMEMRRLANGIVRDGEELPFADASDDNAPSLAAWRSYDDGRRALERWDLTGAESRFRNAVARQARIAPAHLWLAQTLYWRGGTERLPETKAEATRALEQYRLLSGRDSLHAGGVLAMAGRRYPEACDAFDRMRRIDSSAVVAWIGLGDCRAFDRRVMRDPQSLTGWRFRSSFEEAARDYQRASDLGSVADAPEFRGWMLTRLSHVLYTATNTIRIGYSEDSTNFAALPRLDHDTLAFHAVTLRDLSAGTFSPSPSSLHAAIDRNQVLMRHAAEDWVRRSPRDPVAYDSLAAWVESSRGVARVGDADLSALQVVQRALALATDTVQLTHLAVSRVRLLVKDGRFVDAKQVADSVLKSGAGMKGKYVSGIAGLAVLVGDLSNGSRLLARDPENSSFVGSRGAALTLPPQLTELTAQLDMRTALGLGGDSTEALARHVDDLIGSYYTVPSVAAEVRLGILPRTMAFAFPTGARYLASLATGKTGPIDLLGALARGDSATVRRALADARHSTAVFDPGTSIDMTLLRAQAALALRDTAAAVAILDPSLRALPTLGPRMLSEVHQAGALVRALVLRADLAHASGDLRTANQYASAVVTLWGNADSELRPTVDRMKQFIARSN